MHRVAACRTGQGRTLFHCGPEAWTGRDVVYDAADLSPYRVVIAPLPRLMDEALDTGLTEYVRQGGTLVATVLTATLDRDHVAPPERLPSLLRDLFGVERVEWGSLNATTIPPKELMGKDAPPWGATRVEPGAVLVQAGAGRSLDDVYAARVWYDQLHATAAETLARFGEGPPAPGVRALTAHGIGQGRALYVAAVMEQRFYDDLMASLMGGQASPLHPREEGTRVEVVPAFDGSEPVYFVLNHSAMPRPVSVSGRYEDIPRGSPVEGDLELPGYDVAIPRPRGGEASAVMTWSAR